MASDGFQVSGSLMWDLTRISDERVPSILSELRLGVLFLFIRKNILSSPAFEWGMVITTPDPLLPKGKKKFKIAMCFVFFWLFRKAECD